MTQREKFRENSKKFDFPQEIAILASKKTDLNFEVTKDGIVQTTDKVILIAPKQPYKQYQIKHDNNAKFGYNPDLIGKICKLFDSIDDDGDLKPIMFGYPKKINFLTIYDDSIIVFISPIEIIPQEVYIKNVTE